VTRNHAPDGVGMGLANWLTLVRIVLVPVFVTLLVYNRVALALGTFILAGLTDTLDGYIARSRGTKTRLGAFLDPLADKLLLTAAFVTLTYKVPKILPFWLTATVLSRDLLLVLGALLVMLTGGKVHPAPTMLGKLSTVCQMVMVGVALMVAAHVRPFELVHPAMLWLTAALTVGSGLQYMVIASRYIESEDD
jgi:cardiolipin synthase (CMP-forming)